MNNFSEYTTLPTYSRLVDGIQKYINRYDQDTLETIPFFINAAEKVILRNLRMPSLEKMVGFTLEEEGDETNAYVTLPMDYLEMKFVWVATDTLTRVSFDQLIRATDCNQKPIWAINGNRMYIKGVSPTDAISMTYYADVPELTSQTETNILLTLVPDAFLYLAVSEAFKFLMEEARSNFWFEQGINRINEVMLQVANAEFSGSPLAIGGY